MQMKLQAKADRKVEKNLTEKRKAEN